MLGEEPCRGIPDRDTIIEPRVAAQNSPSERIGVFDREAGLADLRRVCGGNTGEFRSDVVDDVKIAVGTVVVP